MSDLYKPRPDMDCAIIIRDTQTGEERTHIDEGFEFIKGGEEFPGGSDYMWREGNYRCDCNRALFFARAGGEPEPDDPPCGEGRFVIVSPEHLREVEAR